MDSAKLKLDESNEIKFKIHVQGSTSEPGASDPAFRFILMEQDSSLGFVFPVKKEQNGTVTVVIPPLEGTLKEGKNYVGKMEVLMGSRYFTPSTLQISFEKEFKVTAEAIVNQNTTIIQEAAPEISVIKSTTLNQSPLPQPQQKSYHVKLTSDDFKRAQGDERKLKKIIVENLAKQLSPRNPEFIPLVEKTFEKVKSRLNSEKIDVDDLLENK